MLIQIVDHIQLQGFKLDILYGFGKFFGHGVGLLVGSLIIDRRKEKAQRDGWALKLAPGSAPSLIG